MLVAATALLASGACRPDVGAPLSLVSGPRVLAVRGMPAEAKPGTNVAYDTLSVDVAGTITDPQIGWALCHAPKPPAEANAVSVACLSGPDDSGPSATFMAPMPADQYDACKFFGPVPRETGPGEPPIRPRDADVTGGFYQPVRATLTAPDGGERAFLLERIHCNLANAPRDVVGTFNATYTDNQNPSLARLTLDPDGQATSLYEAGGTPSAAPASVAPAAVVTLEGAWPDDAVETYPVWNPTARTLDMHREAMRLSWFATAGVLALETTGRGETETETSTRNTWTAPSDPGLVHLWAVLRDSRGGVDFASFDVQVGP
jgi:hypothetical protein